MKKILINVNSWQTRIAIMRDGLLENVYFSAHAQQTLERVFFKGTVSKVLPGIQTAFVEIGQEKAGFLHISEIDRELAVQKISETTQLDDEQPRQKSRQKLDIAKILREGDPILVQVSKEPVYEKGAKLTTCFTLPGRFIVLMPNIPRVGVSKKIEEREERYRLKDVVRARLPEGMGAIIRTTSEGRGVTELVKDIDYLVETWRTIEAAFKAAEPKAKLHEDLPLSFQIVRDHLDDNVEAVITDSKSNQSSLYSFVKGIAPEHSQKIKLYSGDTSIFKKYEVEKQLEAALEKKVELKSGGSLIIETTEAMTVVDVNTGRFTGKSNLEDTIFKTNIEAASEVVRQLRLRNIGGLIVIDFIDMAIASNRQKLFRHFEKSLKEHDKFQSVVLKISEFGIVQMTRKRSGKTLVQQLTDTCVSCHGLGFVKSLQTDSYSHLRAIKYEIRTKWTGKKIIVRVHPVLFDYITNTEYNAILDLERTFKGKITMARDERLRVNEYRIEQN